MPASVNTIANFNNVLTVTQEARQKEVHDQWHEDHAFLFALREGGGFRNYAGGSSIQIPLNTIKDPSVGTAGIWDTVDLADVEHLRPAEFLPTVLRGAVTINRFEMEENAGPEKILDLWDERQRNVMLSMEDEYNLQALQAVGAGDDFGGLSLIVADDPTTGTVGGIDRAVAANAFWRSQIITAVGSFAAGGLAFLRNLRNLVNTSSMTKRSTLHVTTSLVYNAYEATQSGNVRYQGPLGQKIADAGFASLDFDGAPVIWDEAKPAGTWDMINFENFFFKAHDAFQFTFDPPILAESQFSVSAKVALYGQYCTNNPRYLGKGTGITA